MIHKILIIIPELNILFLNYHSPQVHVHSSRGYHKSGYKSGGDLMRKSQNTTTHERSSILPGKLFDSKLILGIIRRQEDKHINEHGGRQNHFSFSRENHWDFPFSVIQPPQPKPNQIKARPSGTWNNHQQRQRQGKNLPDPRSWPSPNHPSGKGRVVPTPHKYRDRKV